ncbi:40680_t:CDS:2, partial [Gigaspora margarita]
MSAWTLTQSNLLFSPANVPVLGKRKQAVYDDSDDASKSAQSSQQMYQKLRRRFLPTYFVTQQEYYAYTNKTKHFMLINWCLGELPDIEIKHSDIIGPLQALAHRNLDISRNLFSTLFISICDATWDNTIISCLRICYEIPDLKIDPSAIRKASEISSTESMVITLIERYLIMFPTQR